MRFSTRAVYISYKKQQYLTEVLMIFYTKYHTVQNFGSKKVWRIRTVGSLVEKTLVN